MCGSLSLKFGYSDRRRWLACSLSYQLSKSCGDTQGRMVIVRFSVVREPLSMAAGWAY